MFLFCTGASNLSPSIFCQRNGISFCQFVQTFRSKATVFFFFKQNLFASGPKTWMAGWHCHPESFCASGKFLRVTPEIAMGSFRTLCKISRQSGYFPDCLESFWIVRKVSGLPRKFPGRLDIFRMIQKVSGQPGKFLDSLESFRIAWKVSGQPGKFPDSLESFRIA